MERSWSAVSCDKIDRVANWVGTSVASAFFASLERCSCINITVTDLEYAAHAVNDPATAPKDHHQQQPLSLAAAADDRRSLDESAAVGESRE